MSELISALIAATNLLKSGGILLVVSFHSLEDKIVKNFFNLYSNLRKNPSRYLPTKENKSSLFKLISKKPLVADMKEIEKNAIQLAKYLNKHPKVNQVFHPALPTFYNHNICFSSCKIIIA